MTIEEVAAGLCPNFEDHTPHPSGYMAWHDWAKRMAKTHRQVKCHGCDRFAIWVPKSPRNHLSNKGADHG